MISIKKLISDYDELLVSALGIISSISVILSATNNLNDIQKEYLTVSLDILNFMILLIALLVIRTLPLKIEDIEFEKLNKILDLGKEKTELLRKRVNELVRQLVYCVRWFIIILGIFYLLQLWLDLTILNKYDYYKHFQPTLSKSHGIIDLINENYGEYDTIIAEFLTLELLTNTTNLFSAGYLIIAFQVLFFVTLADDNKTWSLKGYIPLSIAVLITIANLMFSLIGHESIPLEDSSQSIRFIGGLYNGVAMFLLFGRFISMEYFFQKTRKSFERNFYFFGTIIFLPLYVIAQPLYGVLHSMSIQSEELFKSLVFLICLWGKIVFLFFIITMLKKKWIHIYLFLAISQESILNKISIALSDVEQFDDNTNS